MGMCSCTFFYCSVVNTHSVFYSQLSSRTFLTGIKLVVLLYKSWRHEYTQPHKKLCCKSCFIEVVRFVILEKPAKKFFDWLESGLATQHQQQEEEMKGLARFDGEQGVQLNQMWIDRGCVIYSLQQTTLDMTHFSRFLHHQYCCHNSLPSSLFFNLSSRTSLRNLQFISLLFYLILL